MKKQELTNKEIVKVLAVVEELKASKDAKKAFVGSRLENSVTAGVLGSFGGFGMGSSFGNFGMPST